MSIKALYIHVPFCAHICAYCDFMRVGYHPKLVNDYLEALKKEIEHYDLTKVNTVYFGGGTPSVLSLEELEKLFDIVQTQLDQATEISFEMNPESVDLDKVLLLKKRGVNRISLGVQSFNQKEIKEMDRFHSEEDISSAITLLQANGFNNISIDLMYALPGQTIESLNHSLDVLFKLRLEHFSIYALTIEANSKWGREKRQKIDEDLEADMYELICERAQDAGYRHYEISNFCLDKPSIHNLHYWTYDDYLGSGPGAHSKIGHKRLENSRNLQDYLSKPIHKKIIDLSQEDLAFESLMMGLRVDTGINLEKFKFKTGIDCLENYKEVIDKHLKNDLLVIEEKYLKCTEKGRELLHEILVDFISE